MPVPPAVAAWRARDLRWASVLAVVALVLFAVGFWVRLRCGLGHCPGAPFGRLLDLDAVGGLPRLFTSGLFLAVTWLAGSGARAVGGGIRLWWAAVAGGGLALTVAKLASVHPALSEGTSPLSSVAAGLATAVPALVLLWLTGRRCGVLATAPVVAALAVFAAAALGLDVLTTLAALPQASVGAFSLAAATFVEEFGEALAALLLVVVVHRHRPRAALRHTVDEPAPGQPLRRAR